jgi:LacI family transcriptional regulator
VLIDDAAGAAAAVRHLWQRGHRAIGLLAGPAISHSAQRRIQGYEAALAELGGVKDDGLMLPCSATVAGGRAAARSLLSQRPDMTALLAYNDLVAGGVLQACRDVGRSVPDDLALIGFDDIELASLLTPPLTTLHVSARLLGQKAMGLLLDRLDAPEIAAIEEIVIQPELIVRGSAP